MLGLPSDVAEGFVNTAARVADIARQGGLRDDRPAPGTVDIPLGADDWNTWMRQDIPGVGPLIAPEDPDYATQRRIAEIVPAFLLPELAAARVAGAPLRLGRETIAATTAATGSVLGEEAGRELGQDLGQAALDRFSFLPGETANLAGDIGGGIGMLAGGVVPSAARGALDKGVKFTFQDATPGRGGVTRSEDVYNAATNLGVRPSFGLVGNQQAAQTENILKSTPFVSGMVERRMGDQVEATGTSLARTVSPSYNPGGTGTPVIPRAVGDYAIGDRAQTYLEPARARISAELGRWQDEMYTQMGGREQAMPLAAFDRWYNQIRPTLDATGRDLLDELRATLQRDRTTDIDRALGQRLRSDRQNAVTQLDSLRAQPNPPQSQLQKLADEIQQIDIEIDANLGIRADRLDMARSRIGERSTTGPSLGNLTEGGAKRAVEETQREQVRARGGSTADFNAALAEKRRLASKQTPLREGSDKPFVEKALGQEPQAFYRALTAPEGVGRLIAARRNMRPEEFDTLAADIIQDAAMPTRAGARYATEDFSPANFARAWSTMAPEAKQILFPNPVMRQQLDDAAVLSEAQIRRGQAANPSGSASTAIGAATWYGLLTNPAKTLPFLAGVGAAASPMVDEMITRIIANQYPNFAERMIHRGGAVGSGLVIDQYTGQER